MRSLQVYLQSCLYCESHFQLGEGEVFCNPCRANFRKHPIVTTLHGEFVSRSLLVWSESQPSVGEVVKKLKEVGGNGTSRRFYFAAHKFWTQFYAHEKWAASDILFIPAPARIAGSDDHASHFAKELSTLFGSPARKCLRRVSLREQKSKSREERAENKLELIDGSLERSGSGDSPRKIIFIDDLIVSGETARAAYIALGRPGDFEVWTIAFRPLFLPLALAKSRPS
jgi:predicted amidophosphoribosyltransferase